MKILNFKQQSCVSGAQRTQEMMSIKDPKSLEHFSLLTSLGQEYKQKSDAARKEMYDDMIALYNFANGFAERLGNWTEKCYEYAKQDSRVTQSCDEANDLLITQVIRGRDNLFI